MYNLPPGITTLISSKPGPHIGISYYTHGNEPVGERIVHHLLQEYHIANKLILGTLSFIHVNLQASKIKKRFIDHNMNRIWNNDHQINSYEIHRKQELMPFLDTVDVLFDIHSTAKASPCIGITDTAYLEPMKSFFFGEEIRIDNMQKQGAMIGYFTKQGKPGYGIEAGSHEDPVGYAMGITNIYNFLSYYQIISQQIEKKEHKAVYKFLDEIHCTDHSFRYTKDFKALQQVTPNELIATEKNRQIRNPYTKETIYFGLASKHPIVGDGAGFFFEKIE